MKRTTFALLAGALLVAGLQTAVQAQALTRLKDQLGLTDEQVSRLEKLRADHQTAAQKARAEMIKAEAELRSLKVSPDRDMRAMEAAIKKIGDLRTAQQIANLRNREACLQVLTPEQREKLKTLQGTGRGMMGLGLGQGMGMGGRMGVQMGGRALMGGRRGGVLIWRNRPGANQRPGRAIPPQQLLRRLRNWVNPPAATPPPAIPPLS